MSGFVYESCPENLNKGRLNFSRDRFKTLLVDGYVPDPNHRYRSDVSGEIAGAGYPPGGVPTQVKVDGPRVKFEGFTLPQSTLKATGAIVFKDNGAPMLDLLVAYMDFDGEVESRDGNFTLTDSTLRLET